jgi:gamma-glutamyl-gamma-aminobutyrate hydrolase PuuD
METVEVAVDQTCIRKSVRIPVFGKCRPRQVLNDIEQSELTEVPRE